MRHGIRHKPDRLLRYTEETGGEAVDEPMLSYNLFLLEDGEELFCAVPETRAVPDFVRGQRWTFSGKVDDAHAAPAGFDDVAAATAVRFNGYYLFQPIDRRAP